MVAKDSLFKGVDVCEFEDYVGEIKQFLKVIGQL